jgi:hypothetical protein
MHVRALLLSMESIVISVLGGTAIIRAIDEAESHLRLLYAPSQMSNVTRSGAAKPTKYRATKFAGRETRDSAAPTNAQARNGKKVISHIAPNAHESWIEFVAAT